MIDLKELFSNEPYRLHVNYGEVESVHHIREMTEPEYLEYSRRAMKGSPGTPVWLYNLLCVKLTVNDEDVAELEEAKKSVPPDIKAGIIAAWHGRVQVIKERAGYVTEE